MMEKVQKNKTLFEVHHYSKFCKTELLITYGFWWEIQIRKRF